MLIQVFNAGSSSIKFNLYQFNPKLELLSGILEKVGEVPSFLKYQTSIAEEQIIEYQEGCLDHQTGVKHILEILEHEGKRWGRPSVIAHRVVHGGNEFQKAVFLDQDVIQFIREMIPLARIHHPASLACIEEITKKFPEIPQTAVFDTSFHQTMPEKAWRYALPRKVSEEHNIRRFGFHGISHQSMMSQAADFMNKTVSELNLITIHLGNGASIAAINHGQCVDTSMGMTPLEGLIMGARPGDLDPGVSILLQGKGWSLEELERMLNQESGMKGLCGSNDFREIFIKMKEGDAEAQLGLELYCYRIRKSIGAYIAVLGSVDTLVFTGGVGENASWVRKESLKGLDWMGIQVNESLNKNVEIPGSIKSKESSVEILVLPCQEEWEITTQAAQLIKKTSS